MKNDKCGAGFVSVGEVSSKQNDDESEKVGRRGESLGGEGGVTHVVDDGREEDGHRCECDVAGEEHELHRSVWFDRCISWKRE